MDGQYSAACDQGTCIERICGAASPKPTAAACPQQTSDCIRACVESDSACRANCYNPLQQDRCSLCLEAEVQICVEAEGCAVEIRALRCCYGDHCPGQDVNEALTGCLTCCSQCEDEFIVAFQCVEEHRTACSGDPLQTSACLLPPL